MRKYHTRNTALQQLNAFWRLSKLYSKGIGFIPAIDLTEISHILDEVELQFLCTIQSWAKYQYVVSAQPISLKNPD